VPKKDSPAPLASPAVYAYKDVIAYCPAFGIHHINPADVVSIERFDCVPFVVGEPFRPVVIEKAVLYPAVLRPNRLAVHFRHFDSLDTPLPDVVDNAIVYGQVMDSGLGVDFETVPLDVLYRQISNRHTRASGDTNQLSVSTPGAIDDHAPAMSGCTSQRYVVGLYLDKMRQHIMAIREQNGPPRSYLLQGHD